MYDKHMYLTGYPPSQARAGKDVVRWTDGFDMIIFNNLDIKQQTKLQFWEIQVLTWMCLYLIYKLIVHSMQYFKLAILG